MKKIIHIPLFLLLSLTLGLHAQDVPSTVIYCDVEVKLSPDAQNRIQEYYRQIIASPRYFNEMVKRAQIYMPFIEEAFNEVGIPHDLKYLAIQESALRADVVSSSNAVGFWQMKEGTASDLHLQVDGDIDERMHIFRSSYAAANYLKEANKGYANWVYALLSYYEGPTGSVPYTNPDYYGEKKMNLSANDHWYVLKAIANKLAYEKALNSNERPDIFLMPFVAKAGESVKSILAKHQIEEEEFFRYNKWIHNKRKISRKKDYTYYLPRAGKTYIGHVPDPVKMNQGKDFSNILVDVPPVGNLKSLEIKESPEPVLVYSREEKSKEAPLVTKTRYPQSISQPTSVNSNLFAPKALDIQNQPEGLFVEFQLRHDLHYGVEYVEYTGFTPVAALADRYGKGLASFLMYNQLVPGETPDKGTLIYIEKPEKRNYHIVEEGESLTDIAADHASTVERLQNRNRMSLDNFSIYVGQKLYLRDRKPKDEKIIILSKEVLSYANVSGESSSKEEEPSEAKKVEEAKEAAVAVNDPVEETRTAPGKPAEGKEIREPRTVVPEKVSEPKAPQTTDEALQFFNPDPSSTKEFKPVWVEHIVVSGETLWQISQKYGTEVELIKKINKLKSDNISQGRFLRILATKEF